MASPFANILKTFRSALGGGAGGSVIGIDIGASSAKIVQLRPSKGAAILETYGEIALGPYGGVAIGKAVKLTPEKTAEALLSLMHEANVTSKRGGISIPFASSLVTILEMPKTDPEQLKRMVPIEARKYIPVPASEVTLDWFAIPQEEREDAFDRVEPNSISPVRGQEILLAAIYNDTTSNYQAIASNAGLSIGFYEIEVFSAVRSSLGRGVAPVLVVDIGASTSKVYVVERGVVRLSHLLPAGGQQMTEVLARSMNWEFEQAERMKRESGLLESKTYGPAESARVREALLSTLGRVFSEANRVLLSYGKRYNKNVSLVVLTGGGASLPGLLAEAKQAFGVEVQIADPFAKTESPAFLGDVLHEIGPSFSVALGLALRDLKRDA